MKLHSLNARIFAHKAHEGQLRKDGVTPYIKHPYEVVYILKGVGVEDDAILSAAWLHDVVEDCGVSLEEIMSNFGGEIADLVDGLTQRKGTESKEHYRQRIINSNQEVKLIKLADVLHNVMTTANIVPEKRDKVYNSMLTAWKDYKSFAYKVNAELAERIEEEISKLRKQMEK